MSNALPEKSLTIDEIRALSSAYIAEGLREEQWEITELRGEEEGLKARLRMKSIYVSPTDPGGFHLSSFSAFEMAFQLGVIYLHLLAGLEKKCREVWMLESSLACRQAVRDPENIRIEMTASSMRKIGDGLLVVLTAELTDGVGVFTFSIKFLMTST